MPPVVKKVVRSLPDKTADKTAGMAVVKGRVLKYTV